MTKQADQGYSFEWNLKKAVSNRLKHNVSFEEASTVFADPLSLLMNDPDHSMDEQRYIVLGLSKKRRLLVVSFAERPPNTRIISARQATRKERRIYEEK